MSTARACSPVSAMAAPLKRSSAMRPRRSSSTSPRCSPMSNRCRKFLSFVEGQGSSGDAASNRLKHRRTRMLRFPLRPALRAPCPPRQRRHGFHAIPVNRRPTALCSAQVRCVRSSLSDWTWAPEPRPVQPKRTRHPAGLMCCTDEPAPRVHSKRTRARATQRTRQMARTNEPKAIACTNQPEPPAKTRRARRARVLAPCARMNPRGPNSERTQALQVRGLPDSRGQSYLGAGETADPPPCRMTIGPAGQRRCGSTYFENRDREGAGGRRLQRVPKPARLFQQTAARSSTSGAACARDPAARRVAARAAGAGAAGPLSFVGKQSPNGRAVSNRLRPRRARSPRSRPFPALRAPFPPRRDADSQGPTDHPNERLTESGYQAVTVCRSSGQDRKLERAMTSTGMASCARGLIGPRGTGTFAPPRIRRKPIRAERTQPPRHPGRTRPTRQARRSCPHERVPAAAKPKRTREPQEGSSTRAPSGRTNPSGRCRQCRAGACASWRDRGLPIAA
jgi:hypothetical protein